MNADNDNTARQNQVAELLRAAAQSERAPASLHAQIAAMRAQPAAGQDRRRRSPFVLARVAMPAAAALAAALVLLLGGGAGAPSIAQAAALATRAPVASPPATDPSDPSKLLTARVGTLHFPNWQGAGGWHAVGQRVDHIGNRTATTVYYSVGTRQVVYSIVSSPALTGAKSSGEPYATLWHHGRVTVIWRKDGHTCLLSGSGISPAGLWHLASTR